jgi:hypothetical protein
MYDWIFQVKTNSGLYRNVRVNDYGTYGDAQRAALDTTGAIMVTGYNQVPRESEVNTVVNNYYEEPQGDYDNYDEKEYQKLDKMEEEMYSLMCRIAMENDEELPTIQEFYDYLGK